MCLNLMFSPSKVSCVKGWVTTGDYDEGCETGEGGDVELHAVEGLRKLQDGVDPVSKASDALHFVKHGPITEDELFHFGIGTLKSKKHNSY